MKLIWSLVEATAAAVDDDNSAGAIRVKSVSGPPALSISNNKQLGECSICRPPLWLLLAPVKQSQSQPRGHCSADFFKPCIRLSASFGRMWLTANLLSSFIRPDVEPSFCCRQSVHYAIDLKQRNRSALCLTLIGWLAWIAANLTPRLLHILVTWG